MKLKVLVWILAVLVLAGTTQAALTNGLLAYWNLDQSGATINDSVGVNHLVKQGSPLFQTTVKINGGYGTLGTEAASTGQMLYSTTGVTLSNTTSACISMWIKWNTSAIGNAAPMLIWHLRDVLGTKEYMSLIVANATSFRLSSENATAALYSSTIPVQLGSMNHYVFCKDLTNHKFLIYQNATIIHDNTNSSITAGGANPGLSLSGTHPQKYYGAAYTHQFDEIGIWNRTLTSGEVTSLYNAGTGMTYPFTGEIGNFTITGADEWTSSPTANINATICNGATCYSYTNSTGERVTTVVLTNSTVLWNVTVASTNYFNRTYLNQNVSTNLAGQLHQAEVCFNATQKVSNASVVPNNFSINGAVRTSCFNISAGTYSVQANKTSWYSQNQTVVISALQNNTQTVENMSYANLTISAKDGMTNASLSTCDSSILSVNWTGWTGETQTGTFNDSYYLVNGTYTVSVNCSGYAYDYTVANVSVAGNTNYTFTLYKSNSVYIHIFDEILNTPILSNVTVRWTTNSFTWENVTNTSNLFVSNITAGVYTLLFYSSNYSTRTYTITVGDFTTQTLNAYMISSTYSTIFTIMDADTFAILDNTSITMYKQVNSTWTTVESKYSDISGKAQFYYDPIGSYKFQLDRSDYTQYVFFLNPILFSTYDVYMTKTSLLNYSVDFDKLSIIYAPTMFDNNQNHTFNFLISSPDGLLTTYGIKLTYPGGNCSTTGANAIGSQLSCGVNITGATVYDRVQLDYNYTTTTSGLREYTVYLPININTTSGATWMSNKNQTYGLGLFERLLICTIIVLFTVGIATLVGQALPGLALGLFVYGFLCYIGFVPLWAILPSMLIGVFFLTWKSGGY